MMTRAAMATAGVVIRLTRPIPPMTLLHFRDNVFLNPHLMQAPAMADRSFDS